MSPGRWGVWLGAVVLTACLWACGGEGGGDAAGGGFDVSVVFDVSGLRPDTGGSGGQLDLRVEDAGQRPREDVPTAECVVDFDCAERFAGVSQCVMPVCFDGRCILDHRPDETSCEDGDPCTDYDRCRSGICTSGEFTCECRTDLDCGGHENGDLCDGTLYCDQDKQRPTCEIDPATVVRCDTSQDTYCAATRCVPETGECAVFPQNEGDRCDDGDPCTPVAACTADGGCVGESACQCREDIDCLEFEDGDRCNGVLYCDKTAVPYRCVVEPRTIKVCNADDDTDCLRNTCQPETGLCEPVARPDGVLCEDGNACTVGDSCQAGVCVPGGPADCDDDNVCTNDGCNPMTGACTHSPNTGSCEDEFVCSTGDMCEAGSCRQGSYIDCDDGDPCTIDTCVERTGCANTYDEAHCR